MSIEIVLAVIVTSLATYLSRILGVLTSTKINENSKIYRWFNCLAYSTLAALTSRILVFPNGVLMDTSYFLRIIVIICAILIYYLSKKFGLSNSNFAIILFVINSCI